MVPTRPKAKRCGGFGHLARHHEAVFIEAAAKEKAQWRKSAPSDKRERRLDMTDSHESSQAEGRNKALRLMDALLVTGEADYNDRRCGPRLDFGRGP